MAGIDAFGTTWAIEYVGGSGIFTTIADVTATDVLDVDVDTIDTSSHSSAQQWREFVNGMIDGGELTMEINYDPTLHASIFGQVGGAQKNHRIVMPDAGAGQVDFKALVTGFSAQAPFDDKLSASITLKVTGPVTITP